MALAVEYEQGEASFGGLSLRVEPGTYIPTEWFLPVAEAAASLAPVGGRLLDVGTGVGPIALWAANERPDLEVWGIDLNPRAIELATVNAALLGSPARFLVSDLYSAWDRSVDVITCTLPYSTRADIERAMTEPGWEACPPEAFIGGEDTGYELVCSAAAYGHGYLGPGGYFILYGDTHTAPGWRRMFDLCGYDLVSEDQTNEDGSVVLVARAR